MVDKRNDRALRIARKSTELQVAVAGQTMIGATEKPLNVDELCFLIIEEAKALKYEHRILIEEAE